MSDKSKIEWTDSTWNPTRGCSRVSEGCRNCYAERIAVRMSGPGQWGEGYADVPSRHSQTGAATTGARGKWTGKVSLVPSALGKPLSWRKPRKVFVNSMSDLFHEALSDEAIAAVFGVMAAAPAHTFQILTKRPARMREWFAAWARVQETAGACPPAECMAWAESEMESELPTNRGLGENTPQYEVPAWPLPNVWLGVSVEDQETADARIPLLLQTPAAKRFISYEPALGPVDFRRYYLTTLPGRESRGYPFPMLEEGDRTTWLDLLDWIIVGGESGPGARPFDVAWARSTVEQCKAAGTAVFVKQFGARPVSSDHRDWVGHRLDVRPTGNGLETKQHLRFASVKGGDPAEWPEDLRVREFPR